jgi:succinyl-diaminopimelate desuccinylase
VEIISAEVLQIIKDLIGYKAYSVINANAAIDYCARWLQDNNIDDVQIHENNGYKMLTAWKRSEGEGETIILHGHVDVVPAKEEQFSPCVKDGNRLYGRGSYDMLGAVAVMMHILKRLKDLSPRYNVLLMLVSDEETGSDFGTPFLIKKGYVGDFVICGEPTNLMISIQAKGVLHLEIEVKGVSAHGSRPWLGENAIENGLEVYNSIKCLEFMKDRNELFNAPSINLAKIHGGETLNRVPDQCMMNVDIRFIPGQKVEDIVEQIQGISAIKKINTLKHANSVSTNRDDSFVRKLSEVCTEISGEECSIGGQDGTGDTRFFNNLGIPAVEFGPIGANHHADNEYIDLNSLTTYEDILLKLILNNDKT